MIFQLTMNERRRRVIRTDVRSLIKHKKKKELKLIRARSNNPLLVQKHELEFYMYSTYMEENHSFLLFSVILLPLVTLVNDIE